MDHAVRVHAGTGTVPIRIIKRGNVVIFDQSVNDKRFAVFPNMQFDIAAEIMFFYCAFKGIVRHCHCRNVMNVFAVVMVYVRNRDDLSGLQVRESVFGLPFCTGFFADVKSGSPSPTEQDPAAIRIQPETVYGAL